MFQCNRTATLIQHILEADGDAYRCVVLRGVSWFAKTELVSQEKGLKTQNVLKSRIPAPLLDAGPETGDYLVLGILDSFQSLSDLEGRTYFQVTAVGDNRRGKFPHWAVSGA